MAAAQAGEDGQVTFRRPGGGLGDGGRQAHAGGPQPEDLGDERRVTLRVTAVSPAEPLRARETVPVLPAPQRRGGHAGPSRQLADGQAILRSAHDNTASLFTMPRLIYI